MSAQGLETALARLYVDAEFRERFLKAPEAALADASREGVHLSPAEKSALLAVDRTGLVMASRSYTEKRKSRPHPRDRRGWRDWLRRLLS